MKNAYRIAGLGLAAGAAVMIALTAPASARGPAGGFGGDRAMDGAIGGAMGPGARGVLSVQFTDLDTDGDGVITEAELTARAQALAADRWAEVDTDGDGTVTVEELEAQILAAIADRAQGRMIPGGEQRRAQRGMDPAERAKAMAERILSARDADEDGLLSAEELSPAANIAALVDRFDTDDDNAWSEDEFDQVTMGKGGFGPGDRESRGDRFGKRR